MFSAGTIPYTGPWGYHPGWGRGGNPLPVGENHTGSSQSAPPRSGGSRGEILERAWPGRRPHTLLSCTPTPPALRAPPPPWAGAVQVIVPERPARGSSSGYTLPRHLPIHRTVGKSPGVGPGREPPPRRREPCWPFSTCPAQDRELLWRDLRMGAARKANPDAALLLPHPSRASRSSLSHGRGQCQ